MREILDSFEHWLLSGRRFALARVVSTWGSSPRAIGSSMIIDRDGRFEGSVSGGCVEAAVIEQAAEALRLGEPRLLDYGVDDGTAWSVGLACGGRIRVLVEPLSARGDPDLRLWTELANLVRREEACVLATQIAPPEPTVLLATGVRSIRRATAGRQDALLTAAHRHLEERKSGVVQMGESEVFLHSIPPRPLLLVIGANHIAVALVRVAACTGFRTIVVDPRSAFATADRFDIAPDELLVEWPQNVLSSQPLDRDTFAVLLTHDPKIDDPATELLLGSAVAYIGALGSRRTQEKRRMRLRKKGFTDEDIDRIRGPVGLKIGARTPEEIALSILAEVVQVKNAGHATAATAPAD